MNITYAKIKNSRSRFFKRQPARASLSKCRKAYAIHVDQFINLKFRFKEMIIYFEKNIELSSWQLFDMECYKEGGITIIMPIHVHVLSNRKFGGGGGDGLFRFVKSVIAPFFWCGWSTSICYLKTNKDNLIFQEEGLNKAKIFALHQLWMTPACLLW